MPVTHRSVGKEMGWFQHGSTIVSLHRTVFTLCNDVREGTPIRLATAVVIALNNRNHARVARSSHRARKSADRCWRHEVAIVAHGIQRFWTDFDARAHRNRCVAPAGQWRRARSNRLPPAPGLGRVEFLTPDGFLFAFHLSGPGCAPPRPREIARRIERADPDAITSRPKGRSGNAVTLAAAHRRPFTTSHHAISRIQFQVLRSRNPERDFEQCAAWCRSHSAAAATMVSTLSPMAVESRRASQQLDGHGVTPTRSAGPRDRPDLPRPIFVCADGRRREKPEVVSRSTCPVLQASSARPARTRVTALLPDARFRMLAGSQPPRMWLRRRACGFQQRPTMPGSQLGGACQRRRSRLIRDGPRCDRQPSCRRARRRFARGLHEGARHFSGRLPSLCA